MRFSTLIIFIVVLGVAALVAWKMGYIGQAQEKVEESFGVHLARGKGHYQKTNYRKAIAELEQAMELDPNHPDMPRAMRCMADCYKELGEDANALQAYRDLAEKYPDDKMTPDVEKEIMLLEP